MYVSRYTTYQHLQSQEFPWQSVPLPVFMDHFPPGMVAKLLGRGNKENPTQNLCPPPSKDLGPLWTLWLARSQGTNDCERITSNHPLKLAISWMGLFGTQWPDMS